MPKFAIISDSCCDLPSDIVEKEGLTIVPLTFMIDGKSYKNYPDEREMKIHDFYDLLRDKKLATTSQITPEAFIEAAEPILKQGLDILGFAISSALSGSLNSMNIGKNELSERYPDRKIIVIDSLSASLGQGMLIYRANEMRKDEKSVEETAQWVEANKLRLNHLFTVDSLGTLKRSGRLTASMAFIGTVLNLKPVLRMNDLGQLVAWGTRHGRKVAIKSLLEKLEENITEDRLVFISHGDVLEEAEAIKKAILENHPNNQVFLINQVGPAIGAHTGPGVIAIFFFGNGR